jgi:hypothetical protein
MRCGALLDGVNDRLGSGLGLFACIRKQVPFGCLIQSVQLGAAIEMPQAQVMTATGVRADRLAVATAFWIIGGFRSPTTDLQHGRNRSHHPGSMIQL